MGELFYSAVLCAAMFGGVAEVRTDVELSEDASHIFADCMTDTHYIEVGLDNSRSSRDSVTQAASGAYLNGLKPMVGIIDRDGIEDTHQWEVELTATRADVDFLVVHANLAMRLAMTRYFRDRRTTFTRPLSN
jgi:hypothetical protein